MDLNPTEDPEFASASATIGPDRAGLRMQEALVGLFPDQLPSRKSCRKALDRGDVQLNGHRTNTARRVKAGDVIALLLHAPAAIDPGPAAPQRLHMVRPDMADYVVVWKPAGLATSGSGRLNLANVLRFKAKQGSAEERMALAPSVKDAQARPHPVHRLDRATAGWVCVALNLAAAGSLGQAFAQRQVTKRYLALVAGHAGAGENRLDLEDKDAITRWSPIAQGPLAVHDTATLLKVHIETGRTHQIRRHLAQAGHPIVGEDRYAPPGINPSEAPRFTGHGLFLSAVELVIPDGAHGTGIKACGVAPRKFHRIRWASRALEDPGFS